MMIDFPDIASPLHLALEAVGTIDCHERKYNLAWLRVVS